VNTALAVVWIGIALAIVRPASASRRPAMRLRPLAAGAAVVLLVAVAAPVSAQTTCEEELAAEKAEKAKRLHPYEPTVLEQRVQTFEQYYGRFFGASLIYPFIGSTMEGGGFAVGPAVRARFGDTGRLDAHAAWSVKNYRA